MVKVQRSTHDHLLYIDLLLPLAISSDASTASTCFKNHEKHEKNASGPRCGPQSPDHTPSYFHICTIHKFYRKSSALNSSPFTIIGSDTSIALSRLKNHEKHDKNVYFCQNFPGASPPGPHRGSAPGPRPGPRPWTPPCGPQTPRHLAPYGVASR